MSNTVLVLLALVAFGLTAPAQQRKPKAPKPPSYDEVLQRALAEKKSATNAPVANSPAPAAQPISASQSAVKPAPKAPPAVSAESLLQEARAAKSQPVPPSAAPSVTPEKPAAPVVTTRQPAVAHPVDPAPAQFNPVPSAPRVREVPATTTSPSPILRPAGVSETPPGTKATKPSGKSKGPVFSPLPPDLAPTNEIPKGKSAVVMPMDSNHDSGLLDAQYVVAIGD